MSRAVIGGLRGQNNDVAIATIEPLPAEQVSFTSIRELLDEFLRNHRLSDPKLGDYIHNAVHTGIGDMTYPIPYLHCTLLAAK
jgi:hypothetical protein